MFFFLGLNGSSALFRHEVAFVLGQMQHEASIPYLKESLENVSENEMVRHECAEALGAIATPECVEILKKYGSQNVYFVFYLLCLCLFFICVYFFLVTCLMIKG